MLHIFIEIEGPAGTGAGTQAGGDPGLVRPGPVGPGPVGPGPVGLGPGRTRASGTRALGTIGERQ